MSKSTAKQTFTDKQRKAIDHYIVNREKAAAYRHAYNCENMKDTTIHRKAVELFDVPHVAEAITLAVQYTTSVAKVDAGWVLKRAALLADFNLRKFIRVDDAGTAVYDFSKATDDDWYCITEYVTEELFRGSGDDVYKVDKLKLKTVDKLAALKLVGQHIDVQAFQEKIEHSGEVVNITMSPEEYKKARGQMLDDDDC